MTNTIRNLIPFALVAGLLVGCGGGDATEGGDDSGGTESTDTGTTEALPEGLFTDKAPSDALDVGDAKESAKEGDEIVVRGRVGGVMEPFTKGRAAMTMADMDNVISCADMKDDACTTPWDYCCEEPGELLANTLTVQVVGEDGRPLKAALEGANGIKPLSIVVVKGTVAARPDPKVLVVNVTAIHVEK